MLTCDRARLATALAAVRPAVATKTTMPVLRCVKVDGTDPAELKLSATDLEVGVVASVAVDAPEDSAPPFLLDADTLRSAVGASGADAVRFDLAGSKVKIHVGLTEYAPTTEDPNGFSDPPAVPDGVAGMIVKADVFREAVRMTAFACSKEEGKYAMRGVLIDARGGAFVGTDGKRLSVYTLDTPWRDADNGPSGIVPAKALRIAEKLAADDTDVAVHLTHSAAWFSGPGWSVWSRLVEGRFPPYRDVIPKKFESETDVDAGAFLGAIREATVMTDAESQRVQFKFAKGRCVLEAQGATKGASRVPFDLPYDGKDLSIAFDPDYLREYLSHVAGAVKLKLVGPEKSAVFEQGNALHLVVPLVG